MKKLKKVWMLALLAAGFALAFGGCSNTKDETGTEQGGGAGSGDETGGTGGSENPGDSGSSGNQGSGNEGNAGGQTGGGTEKPDDNVKIITIFDPATYTGDKGKVVDGPDGAKYLEITPDGYSTSFTITEVDITGKTTVKCKVYGKTAKDDAQFVPKLASVVGEGNAATWEELAVPTLKPIVTTPTEITDKIAENAKSYKCKIIQPFTQSTTDWSALKDITVYIGKITAE